MHVTTSTKRASELNVRQFVNAEDGGRFTSAQVMYPGTTVGSSLYTDSPEKWMSLRENSQKA